MTLSLTILALGVLLIGAKQWVPEAHARAPDLKCMDAGTPPTVETTEYVLQRVLDHGNNIAVVGGIVCTW